MVYFIKHTDYIKIGYTNEIHTRLSQLQTSCPVKISILGLIEGTLEDESLYHLKFKHLHSHGEWFKHTPELVGFVETLSRDLMWKHGFDENESSIRGVIKTCRLKNNLSMEELGEKLGVSKQAVLDMETRDAQGRISVNSIEKALNVMGYKYQHRAALHFA
jgi:DNA-binding XRE family transcriptional regulator